MDELYELLEDCCPDVDFRAETHLIDDELLESLDIVMIVGELNDRFDISISADDLLPEHFNSAEAIWNLVQQRMNED